MRTVARAADRRMSGSDFVAFNSGRTEMVELVPARHVGCLRQAQDVVRGRPGAKRPPWWCAFALRSVLFVGRH